MHTFLPMVASAIAAGNCAVIKPSEISSHTERVLHTICENSLDQRFYRSVIGGPGVGQKLTTLKSSQIVFTGGTYVGSLIAKAAAANLIPCILELGGKCPMVIDLSCDIDTVAKKTAHYKFINCGQTCIAPD